MPMPSEAATSAAANAAWRARRTMKRARGRSASARDSYMSVDSYGAVTASIERAAVHPFAVEGHDDVTAMIHGDEAAVALQSCKLPHRRARRLRQRLVEVAHARCDVVREHAADESLAEPGPRDGTGAVIGVIPGADDRGIPDPPRELAGIAAGRGRGGEIAVRIERHRADRAVVAFDLFPQRREARLGMEIGLVDQGQPVRAGKALRPAPSEQHVAAL